MSSSKPTFLKELPDFNFEQFLNNSEDHVYLVGAGISCEPPSCVDSAREIMDAIIKFGTPSDTQKDIMGIKELRFESLLMMFQEYFDLDQKILQYFDGFTECNVNHHFLAHQMRKKALVITTNYDNLIELAVGKTDPNLIIVITNEDFKRHNKPQKYLKKNIHLLYKIHGSLRNIQKDLDTRESVIITPQDLGMQMGGKLYSLGTEKEKLLNNACENRILVIMGYSGGDDLDIIPTIQKIHTLKRIIWISHDPNVRQNFRAYYVDSAMNEKMNHFKKLSLEHQALYQFGKYLKTEVIKIEANTAQLVSNYMKSNDQQNKSNNNGSNSLLAWLESHMEGPSLANKHLFAAKIFMDYNYARKAPSSFKKAKRLFKESRDELGMAKSLHGLGVSYHIINDQDTSIRYLLKASKICEKIGNQDLFYQNLISIGSTYRHLDDLELAHASYIQALEYYKKTNNNKAQAILYNNMGTIYDDMGRKYNDPKKYKISIENYIKAKAIFEKLGELSRIAQILSAIAISHSNLKNFDKAIAYAEESYKLYEKLGMLQGMMLVSLDLCGFLNKNISTKKEKVLHWAKNAINICITMSDKAQLPNLYYSIAKILETFDQNKAIRIYQNAVKGFKMINDEMGYAKSLNDLGDLLLMRKQYLQAKKCFQKALKIANRRDLKSDINQLQEKIFLTQIEGKFKKKFY